MAFLARALRATGLLAFAALFMVRLAGCAESECKFNSDCAAGLCQSGSCVRECFSPVDCPKDRASCNARGVCEARSVDGGVIVDSTAIDSATTDSGAEPIDTSVATDSEMEIDTSSPIDTSVPETIGGSKSYLTKCAGDSECASGKCTTTSPRFCTKSCTTHGDCAHGQLCGGGICRNDDTGQTGCDLTTAAPCSEFCYGTTTAKHCSHTCSSGAECPAGYACSPVVTGKKICVEIERPCTIADQCPTGLGFCGSGSIGCTAKCDTASDCPLRLIGLPAYTCELRSGQKVCVAPSDVVGSDPIGTSCASTGLNSCRSGACDPGTSPASCVQRCSVRGGCPVNWGCFPLEDPGPPATALLVCSPAGSTWLGDSCTRGRECITGICQSPGYCTRLCVDGLCPDGMSCVAAPLTADDGTPIKLCKKP
jgi:hypothetical protein